MSINTDTLVLRDTSNPPLINKGAVLDIADFDGNFVKIYNDFLALSVTNGVLAYSAGTTYDDTVVQYATFNGRTWKWINATPGLGITPGTDPLKWLEVFPTELAHRKNSDTILAEGTADAVTAADIRAFIDAGLTTTTDLSITTHTGTSFLLNSSTGADVTIPEATATLSGLLSSTNWQKLLQTSGINSGDQTLASLEAETFNNKAIDFSVVNDTLYPSVQAVQTQITAFSNSKLDQNLTANTVLDMGGFNFDITNGSLRPGGAYTLVLTDGTVGQVLTTDGAGVTSWSTPSAAPNTIYSANDTMADQERLVKLFGTSSSDKLIFQNSTAAIDVLTLQGDGAAVFGGSVTITGDLIINGTTTRVNSTVSTVVDPIISIGGLADGAPPTVDDNKDRGIEFQWYDGSAKTGFFGFDDSTGRMTFIPDGTNTSEVYAGTKGDVDFAKGFFTGFQLSTSPTVDYVLRADASGNGTWVDPNTLVAGDGNGIYDGSDSLSGATTITQATNTLKFSTTANPELMNLTNGGVAIGAATPTAGKIVDITGDTKMSGKLLVSNGAVAGTFQVLGGTGSVFIDGSGARNRILMQDYNNTKVTHQFSDSIGNYIDPVGAIGLIIGGTVITPGAKFEVVGKTVITDDLTVDTNTLFVDASADFVGINTLVQTGSEALNVVGAINTDTDYEVDGTQVVSNRVTGWGAPTGTATRTTFVTSTVTLPQLAERVKALLDDLITHGMIGA